jgi:NAD(P)H-flavin reductase
MNEIVDVKALAPSIKMFKIKKPEVARKFRAGQFVILRVHEKGERIPLTIADADEEEGTITIISQEVGKTTIALGRLQRGDRVPDLVGPLGKPSEIERFGQVVIIGGGVGTAVAYPEAKALKKAGNRIISIIGARSKDLLILEDEMRRVSDELHVATDDGSKGHHGFVTDVLQQLIEKKVRIDRVVAIGPPIMMKAVANLTRPHRIKTVVSLNPIMVDGTGMCGACRVSVAGQTRFACVDGPSFDGHEVDFDLLMARLRMYLDQERVAMKSLTATKNIRGDVCGK